MRKLLNKKGFTLAELLIVVAIIAVLVAIAIPIFTTQLEKAREQTDAANLRAAYAVAAAAVLDSQGGISAGPVAITQTGDWQYVGDEKIGTFKISDLNGVGDVAELKTGNAYVNVSTEGEVTITASATANYTVVNPINGNE